MLASYLIPFHLPLSLSLGDSLPNSLIFYTFSMLSGSLVTRARRLQSRMEETVSGVKGKAVSCCGQPTMGGYAAWALDEGLTNPHSMFRNVTPEIWFGDLM
jgi:hypothetical protein